MATLGSKSVLRKVNRKDILAVNVPKACETVIHPEAPLALRLQSGLLIGIARVYSQQFQYLYLDVSSAHNGVRKLDSLNKRPVNLDQAAGAGTRYVLAISLRGSLFNWELLVLNCCSLKMIRHLFLS